jgi:uncharacterized protein YbjQ (UPF0145 family)
VGWLDWLRSAPAPGSAVSQRRQDEIQRAVQLNQVPPFIAKRLGEAKEGRVPWLATLTPAELQIARSHGLKPIATVMATCWLHYGWSWTEGHGQGWEAALKRLRAEAKAAGANAVLDVKMRTVSVAIAGSMDFSLVGTAVRVEGLPPSNDPVISTVSALEFVRLLECNVVPTGLAVGAHYDWFADNRGRTNLAFAGNVESRALSELWNKVRRQAHGSLMYNALRLGNGVLAHVNFSQMFEFDEPKRYLARHIIVATVIDEKRTDIERKRVMSTDDRARRVVQHCGDPIPIDVRFALDMHAGKTPLQASGARHHQSYSTHDEEGAI